MTVPIMLLKNLIKLKIYLKKFRNLDIKIFDNNFGGATRSRNFAIEYFKKIN